MSTTRCAWQTQCCRKQMLATVTAVSTRTKCRTELLALADTDSIQDLLYSPQLASYAVHVLFQNKTFYHKFYNLQQSKFVS